MVLLLNDWLKNIDPVVGVEYVYTAGWICCQILDQVVLSKLKIRLSPETSGPSNIAFKAACSIKKLDLINTLFIGYKAAILQYDHMSGITATDKTIVFR